MTKVKEDTPVYNEQTPPDRLYKAIRLALADMKAVCKIPGASIDMAYWVRADEDNGCSVCMAGAVMMNTLEAVDTLDDMTPFESIDADAFGFVWGNVFRGLNEVRDYAVIASVMQFYDDPNCGCAIPQSRDIPGIKLGLGGEPVEYEDNAEDWHHNMNLIADILEKQDL